eukprot:4945217-Pyramimonas_sp.AAC.1
MDSESAQKGSLQPNLASSVPARPGRPGRWPNLREWAVFMAVLMPAIEAEAWEKLIKRTK